MDAVNKLDDARPHPIPLPQERVNRHPFSAVYGSLFQSSANGQKGFYKAAWKPALLWHAVFYCKKGEHWLC